MKTLTTDQKLKKLISTNSPILNAILCERLFQIKEITLIDMEDYPEAWENSIIHPNLYKELFNNIESILK
jgi:hypothetical protein